jgi:hypothetical protein
MKCVFMLVALCFVGGCTHLERVEFFPPQTEYDSQFQLPGDTPETPVKVAVIRF